MLIGWRDTITFFVLNLEGGSSFGTDEPTEEPMTTTEHTDSEETTTGI